jgi:hypothetical protein
VEYAKLAEDGGAVVVDFFAGEAGGTLRGWVEGVDAAEGEFDAAAGGGEATPCAEMSAADEDFDEDGFGGNVAALDVDLEVGQSVHELLIELLDAVAAGVVGVPGLVIIAGGVAQGGEDAGKVVGIFQADVLFDQGDAGGEMVVSGRVAGRCVRSWCTGHGYLRRRRRNVMHRNCAVPEKYSRRGGETLTQFFNTGLLSSRFLFRTSKRYSLSRKLGRSVFGEDRCLSLESAKLPPQIGVLFFFSSGIRFVCELCENG